MVAKQNFDGNHHNKEKTTATYGKNVIINLLPFSIQIVYIRFAF